MKRTVLIVVGIIIITAVVGYFIKQKTDQMIQVETNQKNIVESRMCFKYHHEGTEIAPYTVDEEIMIVVENGVIAGTKSGTQKGPDMQNGYTGTLSGTIVGDQIKVVFDYIVEGSRNREEEWYIYYADKITKQRFPLIEDEIRGVLVPHTSAEPQLLDYYQIECK